MSDARPWHRRVPPASMMGAFAVIGQNFDDPALIDPAVRAALHHPLQLSFDLDFSADAYEIGARLISLLVAPGDDEKLRRKQVNASLCSAAIRGRLEADPKWGLAPQRLKPGYALRTIEENKRALRPYRSAFE